MALTLRAARINKGYTQKKAADEIGISKYTLSNYERGRYFPKAHIIKRMEKVYGEEYDNLIFLPQSYDLIVKKQIESHCCKNTT